MIVVLEHSSGRRLKVSRNGSSLLLVNEEESLEAQVERTALEFITRTVDRRDYSLTAIGLGRLDLFLDEIFPFVMSCRSTLVSLCMKSRQVPHHLLPYSPKIELHIQRSPPRQTCEFIIVTIERVDGLFRLSADTTRVYVKEFWSLLGVVEQLRLVMSNWYSYVLCVGKLILRRNRHEDGDLCLFFDLVRGLI